MNHLTEYLGQGLFVWKLSYEHRHTQRTDRTTRTDH